MPYLLNNRFSPFTFSVGFIEAPFDRTCEMLLSWRKEHCLWVRSHPLTGTLEQILPSLEPATWPDNRELLVETPSRWTAFFNNATQGGQIDPPVEVLASRLQCHGLITSAIPMYYPNPNNAKECTGYTVIFSFVGPEGAPVSRLIRHIQVMNDYGRWTFGVIGDPLPFESPEAYKARKVKDRFTVEQLTAHCAELDIRLFDPSFYGPLALCVEQGIIMPPNHPSISMLEAQRQLGIRIE